VAWPFNDQYKAVGFPVIATLDEGLRAHGLRVVHTTSVDYNDVEEGVVENVRHGFTPIVIIIFFHKVKAHTKLRMGELVEKGAYMILYNTEPKRVLSEVFGAAWRAKASEVWDYSHSTLHYLQEIKNPDHNVTLRYVPPGCAEAMDVGVNLDAPSRDEHHIGHVGMWTIKMDAAKLNKSKVIRAGGGERDRNIKSPDDWQHFMEQYPVQVNLHSRPNSIQALEALRISMLLTNRCCVLSALSFDLDMAAWNGTVQFFDADDWREVRRPLIGNHSAILQCQKVSHEIFCERFPPKQILINSGFASVLELLRMKNSASKE